MLASSALTGSISVTMTRAPCPLARSATPRPQKPNPATTIVRPASSVLVARMMPSSVDWPVPYLLSNIRFVRVSLTATTGKRRACSAAIWRSRMMPVVVSSHPPVTPSSSSTRSVCSVLTRSQPSSSTMSGPMSRAWWRCR